MHPGIYPVFFQRSLQLWRKSFIGGQLIASIKAIAKGNDQLIDRV
jgi:hypothetical protein